jgi:hypothetical protein
VENVTVRCGCGRDMHEVGTARRGTYRCGCGAQVLVTATDPGSCTAQASDGTRCRTRPTRESAVLGLSLCVPHLEGFVAILRLMERAGLAPGLRPAAQFPAAYREWERNRQAGHAARTIAAREDGIVYYVRIGDRIKIGWTGCLHARMGQLMPDEIMAVEPGPLALERQRHDEFCGLLIVGERFKPAPRLLAHIAEVRKRCGDPPAVGHVYGWRPPWEPANADARLRGRSLRPRSSRGSTPALLMPHSRTTFSACRTAAAVCRA